MEIAFKIAGAALTAFGQKRSADDAADIDEQRAEGREIEARHRLKEGRRQQALAQRRAIEEGRKTRKTESDLIAATAASGGTADDPTASTLRDRIVSIGEHNKAVAIYEGDVEYDAAQEEAALLRHGANIYRTQAKQKRRSGGLSAFSTLLAGAGSIYTSTAGGKTRKAVV